MKFTRLLVIALLGLFVSPSYADLFGLANGRTVNTENMAGLSVEAGANIGSDLTIFGARVNYKLSPDLTVFGDLGQADLDPFSGLVFGVGAFYHLRNITLIENTDFGVKASFHTGELELDGCTDTVGFFGFVDDFCDISAQELAIEAHISGDQLSTTNFAWYGNAGIHILEDSNEIGFGGGIVGDLGIGQWYGGLDFIDEIAFVGGFRYNLN